jgi:hypothetical protein
MIFDRKELVRSFFTTLDKKDRETWLRHRTACDKSLFFFIKDVGGASRNQGGDINEYLHKAICDRWQDRSSLRNATFMPRLWRKTTVNRWRWLWEYLQDPEITILVPSEKKETAATWVKALGNQIIRNERLRWLYPELQVINQKYRKSHQWSGWALELPRNGDYPAPTISCTGIKGASQGGHYDLICLLPGSKVYTSNGLVPIESVEKSTRVLCRDGHHHPVLSAAKSDNTKPCREIKVRGSSDPIRCTHDHRILIYRDGTTEWVPAEMVRRGDYTCIPIPGGKTRVFSRVNKTINRLMENNDFWRFIGYWLAEGCATERKNRVRLTFNITETNYADDVKSIIESLTGSPVHIHPTKSSTLMVSFSNGDVRSILNKFGSHAVNKHIPPMILSAQRVKQRELIMGYLRGDGCSLPGNGWAATSISQSLLTGIQQLLSKQGISSSVRRSRPARAGVMVAGNMRNTQEAFNLHASSPLLDVIMGTPAKMPLQDQQITTIPGYLLFPVVSNEHFVYDGPVYDLSISGENSFTVSGGCVHNCPDDLVGEKGYESQVVMEDAFRWFDNVEELLNNSDTNTPNPSRISLTGTHWGVSDLGIYIQREYPEYQWYITPCRFNPGLENTENVTWLQHPDTEPGEVNWPEAFSTKHYVDMQANPQKEAVYYAQHMNCPRDSTTLTKFDGAWLRFYKFETIGDDLFVVCEDDGQRFRVADFPLWGMIDPGGFAEMKLMKKGSRNAILIGGQPRDSVKKFVIETWAGRLKEPSKFLDKLFEMNDRRFVRGWMVETVGAQKYIFRDIQQEKKIRGKNLTILEMPSDVSKGAKDSDILGLLQPMQNGEIYVHRSMKELIAEIREYPSGLTVDLVDMLSKLNRHRWKRQKQGELKSSVKPVVSGETGASSVTGYLALVCAFLGPYIANLVC